MGVTNHLLTGMILQVFGGILLLNHLLGWPWQKDDTPLKMKILSAKSWRFGSDGGTLFNWVMFTLPETNIAPENRPSQKEMSIPTIHFQVRKC